MQQKQFKIRFSWVFLKEQKPAFFKKRKQKNWIKKNW